ncbi:hypothetical protein QBC37DRAFT_74595 [Rhypophila decipiens]|uniref:Uncharacterized protein n=1 Tax=Rhypophila decipiens TaxID=261697 RepID=A0AAN6YK77_9PEZI|nr:hypothetical protein QBC37DRAFT_74595 [Rhypophila decipiens]
MGCRHVARSTGFVLLRLFLSSGSWYYSVLVWTLSAATLCDWNIYRGSKWSAGCDFFHVPCVYFTLVDTRYPILRLVVKSEGLKYVPRHSRKLIGKGCSALGDNRQGKEKVHHEREPMHGIQRATRGL